MSISHFRITYSWSLCTNMTSSIKPEVHKLLQRPEGGSSDGHITCTKFGRAISEICLRTGTNRHSHQNNPLALRGKRRSKNTRPDFTKFSVHVTCDRGSVLFRQRCDMLCTSGLCVTSCFHAIGEKIIQRVVSNTFARGQRLLTGIARGEVCCALLLFKC